MKIAGRGKARIPFTPTVCIRPSFPITSRTHNKAKDGSRIVRMYYCCGNFRSKGSAVCSASSIRKQDAERYVFERLKQVLAKPQILSVIVQGINDRKVKRIKPLQEEQSALLSRIEEIQSKKQRYTSLFEMDQFDIKLFSGRLAELEGDLDRLNAKRSEIEFELNGNNSQTVTYEQVRSLIAKFEHLLRSSPPHQQKTLLHLIIQKITVDANRQIDKIEMIFDETTEHDFLNLVPSAESTAEEAFLSLEKSSGLSSRLSVVI
jgi:site-specific DNA recombinase